MIDAKGIAARNVRIRFRSILLLFFAGLAVSFLAVAVCAAYHVPQFSSLASVAAGDLTWILGYQILAEDRDWVSLRARFSVVRSSILWACAALAVTPTLVLIAIVKVLTWTGVDLPPLPAPDFLLGKPGWLPATFLIIVFIAPAAEELMIRGLLLDWLRQMMAVWPAILISALVFGLLHGIALQSGVTGWLQFGIRTAFGILAAHLAVRYRSLRPSFVLHAANNCFVLVASGFAT
jgi:membrane protease YdiL (CAAX protease family)